LFNGGVTETVQSTVSELEALATWEMRDTLSISTRPSHETEIDIDDASHVAVLQARYKNRLPCIMKSWINWQIGLEMQEWVVTTEISK
jgi:hypothetical protein